MTREVIIRRCVVRVVRHGGWNWSPAPRRLVDRIIGDLPQLISHHLDGLDVPDGDAELTTPVRIAIRIPASDLRQPGHKPAYPRYPETATRLISAPRSSQPADSRPPQPAGSQPPPGGQADSAAPLPPQPRPAVNPADGPAATSRSKGRSRHRPATPASASATNGSTPRRPARASRPGRIGRPAAAALSPPAPSEGRALIAPGAPARLRAATVVPDPERPGSAKRIPGCQETRPRRHDRRTRCRRLAEDIG